MDAVWGVSPIHGRSYRPDSGRADRLEESSESHHRFRRDVLPQHDTSTVQLQIAYDSMGAIDNCKNELEAVSLRVARDLKQFKVFIELRSQET